VTLSVTVHRGTRQIGGSLIEIVHPGGERLILDAGQALDLPEGEEDSLPASLDTRRPASVLLSHAHLDHWGLVPKLPADWPVHCGAATARLIAAAPFAERRLPQPLVTWESRDGPLRLGPFSITPRLTDHSAFDAYMLQVDGAGRRILYTGDFRRHGRKAVLVDRLMANPPEDIDLLIIEGTNLGTDKPWVTEAQLEDRLVERCAAVPGRVFVAWSGQNFDRTVTLYRAAKRSGRDLVVDLYTADMLEQVAEGTHLPRPGWDNFKVVITRGLRTRYGNLRGEGYIDRMSRHGIGAGKLEGSRAVVMLRQGLVKDYAAKGVRPGPDDLFLWSMWDGYLANGDAAYDWCKAGGTPIEKLHTSGHAATADLIAFARAMAPRAIMPVHGAHWDSPPEGFGPLLRQADGVAHRLA
jgi:ribonuclease J